MESMGLAFLVADGDAAFSGQVARALRRIHPSGEIDLVTRAKACLARAASRPFDLILLGDRLPDAGAAPVLQWLADRDGAPPVIVLLSADSETEVVDLFRRGAADCLVKSDKGLAALAARARVLAAKHHRRRERMERDGRTRAIEEFDANAPQSLPDMRALQQQVLQSEKMAGLGQLAAGVAHEINNPMGFIHANLTRMAEYVGDLQKAFGLYESLRTALTSGDAARVREAFARVAKECDAIDIPFVLDDLAKAVSESVEGAERITHIVRSLRELSHRDPAEREPADVHRCIDGAARMIEPMLGDRVALLREYGDLPPVRCYPLLLGQVFINLLVNACQAIDGRGAVRVRTRADADRVVIAIADTGRGIPPEHLGRIFDPFFTTKEVGVGTGLGLSTSYSIIQRHRGRISARSAPGRGSVFTIALPLD